MNEHKSGYYLSEAITGFFFRISEDVLKGGEDRTLKILDSVSSTNRKISLLCHLLSLAIWSLGISKIQIGKLCFFCWRSNGLTN